MKRLLTAMCLAAACAVGLAAQQTAGAAGTASQDPQADGGQGRGGGPRTFNGCLREGETAGTYTLTNVQGLSSGRRGGDATATGGSATGGGTSRGTGTGTAGAQGQGGGIGPMSLTLTADSNVDLKAHVGHQVEVVGTISGGGRGQGGGAATGTGARGNRSMTVTSIRMLSSTCTEG